MMPTLRIHKILHINWTIRTQMRLHTCRIQVISSTHHKKIIRYASSQPSTFQLISYINKLVKPQPSTFDSSDYYSNMRSPGLQLTSLLLIIIRQLLLLINNRKRRSTKLCTTKDGSLHGTHYSKSKHRIKRSRVENNKAKRNTFRVRGLDSVKLRRLAKRDVP
ncbi:hypothetical protein B0O99DRAFT_641956 [Bisporella sp. PMI_857]|nr:hypothetical protein B0O99DRAFT_641956 [Bisporella sp. PMI_857]